MDILQGNQHASPDDFYNSLRAKLEDHHDFPEDYLFKFIIPTDQAKLTEIYRVFDGRAILMRLYWMPTRSLTSIKKSPR